MNWNSSTCKYFGPIAILQKYISCGNKMIPKYNMTCPLLQPPARPITDKTNRQLKQDHESCKRKRK